MAQTAITKSTARMSSDNILSLFVEIASPSNADYQLMLHCPFDLEIKAISAVTSSGTCDLTLKHGSTPTNVAWVTEASTTLNVSTTENNDTTISNNSLSGGYSDGDALYFTISNNSSAADLQVQIYAEAV